MDIQGNIESVCKYTLRVMDGATFMPWTTALKHDGSISYLLPANRRYSITFNVENAAGAMRSDINFSELHVHPPLLLYLVHCHWRSIYST